MTHSMNISRRKLLGTAGAAAALTLAPQMSFAQTPKSGGDLVIAINGAGELSRQLSRLPSAGLSSELKQFVKKH